MKKIITAILLMVMICTLTGCASKVIYNDASKTKFSDQFVIIKDYSEGILGNELMYIYDKDTKLLYLYTLGGGHATMCPYYVVINGVPQVAIYGETYK